MDTSKIGEFLTGLTGNLDMWRISELVFIVMVLSVSHKMSKKQPDRARWVTIVAANSFMGTLAPFAFLQLLSAFGLHMFDADWTKLEITPLDIMFWMSIILMSVMSGKELFGARYHATPPAEGIEDEDRQEG